MDDYAQDVLTSARDEYQAQLITHMERSIMPWLDEVFAETVSLCQLNRQPHLYLQSMQTTMEAVKDPGLRGQLFEGRVQSRVILFIGWREPHAQHRRGQLAAAGHQLRRADDAAVDRVGEPVDGSDAAGPKLAGVRLLVALNPPYLHHLVLRSVRTAAHEVAVPEKARIEPHVGHAAQRRVVLKLEDHAREFTAGAVLVPRKLRNQVQQFTHAFALKR